MSGQLCSGSLTHQSCGVLLPAAPWAPRQAESTPPGPGYARLVLRLRQRLVRYHSHTVVREQGWGRGPLSIHHRHIILWSSHVTLVGTVSICTRYPMLWSTLCYFPRVRLNIYQTPCSLTHLLASQGLSQYVSETPYLVVYFMLLSCPRVCLNIERRHFIMYSILCKGPFQYVTERHNTSCSGPGFELKCSPVAGPVLHGLTRRGLSHRSPCCSVEKWRMSRDSSTY